MSLGKFLISKRFLKHLLAAVTIVIVLLFALFKGLNGYTNHGEALKVPDVTGLNETQVRRILGSNNMRFEIIDSVYSANDAPGAVVDQIPKADSKVKEGRKIFLTINAIAPRMVSIPDIRYSSLRQARSHLKGVGLKVGDIMYAPSENENLVMDVFFEKKAISNEDMVPFGSSIDLVVGKRSSQKTSVPALKGLTEKQAKLKLVSLSLNLGTVVKDNSQPSVEGDTIPVVYMQDRIDEEVFLGTSVNIWVTLNDSLLLENEMIEGEKLD